MEKTLNNYYKRAKYKIKIYSKSLIYQLKPSQRKEIIDKFHNLFYDSGLRGLSWGSATFLGKTIQKCPFDLFIYQEILSETKPDIIIEAGTAFGGGALFLASICELLNKGRVITIDTAVHPGLPKHKKIKYLVGSSIDQAVIGKIRKQIRARDKVLVILDSDHSKKHVLKELKIYSELVSKGSYLIVEDTNVNGHPVYKDHGPGPNEAVKEFLEGNPNFKVDKSREKFLLTFNPDGYLKRIA